ncbi:MAG TPA: amidase [Pyrinomonadaceae bacterium]|jgi:Asp-tRNA(Asn)/Glu-tRNA(Gln) amidotransferase A subunit family amidase|nr:amidase [Pyrinomonadaceae bacterium]
MKRSGSKKARVRKPFGSSEVKNVSRRNFVKLVPALGAAALATPHLNLASALAQTPSPIPSPSPTPAPLRVTKDMLRQAEKLIGIELTDAQEAMALANASTNLDRYEALRKIEVPLDTEPATLFHPALPGKKFNARSAKFQLSKVETPKFSSLEELAFAPLTQLAELVRTRKVSPVELTRMYLGRLKKFGPKLNCVVTLTEDLALAQASNAEREIKAGRYRGPLHGIPWGAKDLFATKGIRTTWGAEPYRDQVIDYDATVVERLRDAGAVLVAKLSMGALAQGGRWFAGMTRNPWQVEEDRIGSSGSSAGPASATAAGLVGFSIGTETLGSIISPSSRCGVAGLRPTYGRISRYGAMGLSWTMDKIGPICRGVEDCAAALSGTYGPDGRDLTVGDVPFNWEPSRPLANLRIGYLKTEFDQQIDPERKTIYQQALDALKSAGAKLQPIELPKFSVAALRIILVAEAATAFDDITRDGRVNELSGQTENDWPNTFRSSRFIPAVEYIRAQRARRLLMHDMEELMSKWDVFVSPAPGSQSLLVTNLTGHPAVCVPCGFPKSGLPQSIMFTGGLYDEGAPLRVALAYERATTWHTMHPKMDSSAT